MREQHTRLYLPDERNSALQNVGKKKQWKIPFLLNKGVKRFYNQVYNCVKQRGYAFPMVLLGFMFVVSVCLGKWETVPYTKRTHFMLLPRSMEEAIGEGKSEYIKTKYQGKIVGPLHPDNIMVQSIAKDIIEAFQRESRKNAVDAGNLEGWKWEVFVVNHPEGSACCYAGGKIIVFTEYLDLLTSGAEIASVIGHEVAHAVARHHVERATKFLLIAAILQLILYLSFESAIFDSMPYLLKFLRHPFPWRTELEADYIGMLLAASAGYDPRAAVQFREKMGRIERHKWWLDYFDTHPSYEKRAQILAQAKVMKKALSIYKEAQAARQGVKRFG